MSEDLDLPLHGLAIYNPQLLSRDELLCSFVAREEQLDRIMAALRREAAGQPQHHLVVGSRGMGKTTLLTRLRYAIEEDATLAGNCLPVLFPEEQYNIGNLADFWLNCVDALADVLESRREVEMLAGLDREIARIHKLPAEEERRRLGLQMLCSLAARLDRRLVLLVDNVDMVLDRIDEEEWALREVLSSEASIQLIGATSASLESHYRHDRAFYDFFRVHRLEGLTEEETFTVLRKLATASRSERVGRLLDEQPARIRTIRLMSGGNPRTIVLLFTLLEQGTDGDVRTDLERLLDLCTPLYKHRIEALSPQVQQILDALAMHWHPTTSAELAMATHLKVNAVSSQLERLVKDGVIEKVSLPGKSRLGYQIAERFFNIWCLMRASRRVRRRLVWLVEFLRLMFGGEELSRLARCHLSAKWFTDHVRRAEWGLALADAIDASSLRHALETDSVRALCVEQRIRERLTEFLDLEGVDSGLMNRTKRMRCLAEARESVMMEGKRRPGWGATEFWELLSGTLALRPEQKAELARGLSRRDDREVAVMTAALMAERESLRGGFVADELTHLIDAVRGGDIDLSSSLVEELEAAALIHGDDVIPSALAQAVGDVDFELFTATLSRSRSLFTRAHWAMRAARAGVSPDEIKAKLDEVVGILDWSAPALHELAQAFRLAAGDLGTAEVLYRRAISKAPGFALPYEELASLYHTCGREAEAETLYREALARNPAEARCWQNLSRLLYKLGRSEEAESAARQSLTLDPSKGSWWGYHGVVLTSLGRFMEAERAFREAISRDAKDAAAWGLLGRVLFLQNGRDDEAEHAFREAIARDASVPEYWENLAQVLHHRLGFYEDAEAAYREAISRGAKRATAWDGLGRLLQTHLGRDSDAESAYREATVSDPTYADGWNNLAWTLYVRHGATQEAVESARTAVCLDPSDYKAHTVATILVAGGAWSEALPWTRQFLSANAAFLDEIWSDVLRFFAEAVTHGFHVESRTLLASLDVAERWEPLVRALEVVERGVQLLGALAPEMREAVRLVLQRIAPGVLDES